MSRSIHDHSLAIIVLSTVAAFPYASLAQPVSVSLADGVHVRAPFVSVDVWPGGVSVRAPYTAVDVGRGGIHTGPSRVVVQKPVTSAPLFVPSAEDLAAMDRERLAQTLRNAFDNLSDRLGRFDTGATWQRYLRLPDELMTDTYSADAAQREAAENLLARFNEIATDGRYRKIADLPEFVVMQSVLAELAKRTENASPPDRKREEVLPLPRQEHGSVERSLLQPPVNQ
jgi:hypothetical protein